MKILKIFILLLAVRDTDGAGNETFVETLRSRRRLGSVGDNRDKIATMLYYRLQNLGLENVPIYTDVLQYGCWCQLLGDYRESVNHGAPVDDLDMACRSWRKCNECTGIDMEGCPGIEMDYGNPYLLGNGKFSCHHTDHQCAQAACECDVELVDQLTTLIQDYNPLYSSSEASFDPVESCHSTVNGNGLGGDDLECCGEHPKRFPYSTQGNTRGCCAGKTYSKDSLMCCNDIKIDVVCEFDSCEPNPCENGGQCQHTSLGAQCTCPIGFTGPYCETVSDHD